MPTLTLTATTENALRLVAAIEHSGFLREESEADLPYVERYLRHRLIGVVHTHEQYEAIEGVPLDEDVVT